MNQAIHEILNRAEDYADRKGDPSLRDELKILEKAVSTHIESLELELAGCKSLISEMARASQADSDLILQLRRQLSDEQHVIQRHSHNVRRVRRGLDIVVQFRLGTDWGDRASYNEMSDDYAESNSKKFAEYLMHQVTTGVLK